MISTAPDRHTAIGSKRPRGFGAGVSGLCGASVGAESRPILLTDRAGGRPIADDAAAATVTFEGAST
jgi:hypothetical protein